MKKLLAALVAVGALVLATASPGGAIVGGEVDGENHPNVAIIYMQSAEGRFRCSATLISPTVLLTAAHCTEGTLGKVLGSFSTSLPASPPRPADPAAGYQTGEVPGFFTGTAYSRKSGRRSSRRSSPPLACGLALMRRRPCGARAFSSGTSRPASSKSSWGR